MAMTLFLGSDPQPDQPAATLDLSGHTVLLLHAHPDDEAIFTGITARRLADAGARVVLVTATGGELGESLVALAPGETVAQRRLAELEQAAELLGVARLVLLGHRDSGLPGWLEGGHPDALISADADRLASKVADVALAEGAATVVHYDPMGIYGHPDHVVVHRVGALAARLAGATAYQATVDREHLHFAGSDAHLVHGAARAVDQLAGVCGRVTAEISLAVAGSPAQLQCKRDAIAVHASQIPAGALREAHFGEAYELEWYLREGPAGVLDRLGNVHALGRSAPVG
jgi:LmbE family N-acetylglucosaminyl deacetylase